MTDSFWTWTVPLETYDRRPELCDDERAALAESVERMNRFQTPLVGDIQKRLERLAEPLWAALAATSATPTAAQQAVNLVLRQMHERQTTYWAWNSTEWGEVADIQVRSHGTKTSLLCIAYLLGGMRQFYACGKVYHTVIAERVFGKSTVNALVRRVEQVLLGWGYCVEPQPRIVSALTGLMLLHGSPILETMSYELLDTFRHICPWALKRYVTRIANVFVEWGILKSTLPPLNNDPRPKTTTVADIAPAWVTLCQRWLKTATLRPQVKQGYYYVLLHAGRWLNSHYPHVTIPDEWTRDIAMEYVVSLRERRVGDYATSNARLGSLLGKPMKSSTHRNNITVMRTFFRNCEEWEWAKLSFDPLRYFKIPYHEVYAKAPNPRIIADDLWAKLVWAGLNLQPDDLPMHLLGDGSAYGQPQYPFEMMHALALVWLFSGLRSDEIRRLRVGCIRWEGSANQQTDDPNEQICLLDVPVNKTSAAFTKPIAAVAGKAVERWEAVRPPQPLKVDGKTHERVAFLFSYRSGGLGTDHLNRYLIPLLCRKANIPQEDARGRITSHRARSTIASQLANAREPMTLLELMQWLGHTSTHSTQHYVKVAPGKLMQAYSEAGYFDRNLRTIRVLLDQETVRTGAAGNGNAWKYYDLGHGYCSYDFFDQCPHRMACAKCGFYMPKDSSAAQILEAKANLQHMLQQIPLTDTEIAAVEDGVQALEHLQLRLLDIPTPSGKTPRDLQSGFVHLDDIS